MRIVATGLIFWTLAISSFGQKSTTPIPYFPPAHTWAQKTPTELGLNSSKLAEAVAFAKASESKNPRSMEQSHYQTFGKEPYGFAIGPFNDRGDQTGLIVYKGYIVAQWGEPSR